MKKPRASPNTFGSIRMTPGMASRSNVKGIWKTQSKCVLAVTSERLLLFREGKALGFVKDFRTVIEVEARHLTIAHKFQAAVEGPGEKNQFHDADEGVPIPILDDVGVEE